MTLAQNGSIRVGVAGFGAIGRVVVDALLDGVPGVRLSAICVRDASAVALAGAQNRHVPVFTDVWQLVDCVDVVVECLPAAAFREVAYRTIEAGRALIPMSVGQLLLHEDLLDLAERTGARILVPTGAVLGLDGLRAAREASISNVKVTTRKPAAALPAAGAAGERPTAPVLVFSGSVREGALRYPANVNVAVAVALAGLGPDRTELDVWMDPTAKTNTHLIEVESDVVNFSIQVQCIPSADNPRTSRLAALSAIAQLRMLATSCGLVV